MLRRWKDLPLLSYLLWHRVLDGQCSRTAFAALVLSGDAKPVDRLQTGRQVEIRSCRRCVRVAPTKSVQPHPTAGLPYSVKKRCFGPLKPSCSVAVWTFLACIGFM